MHCELLVPALFPARARLREALEVLRLPALELLLARGRHAGIDRGSPERWLLDEFGCEDEPLAAGALTALALGAEPGEALWVRADPVHLQLDRDRLRLVPSAAFSVTRAEAEALCAALNRHFSVELSFHATQPDRWCARLAAGEVPAAAAPLEIAGEDVNLHLPAGAGATRWHALLNEIQMVMHGVAANEAREERGEPLVNSVWLWGAGRLPRAAHGRWRSVSAEEPVALGLARLAGIRHRGLAADADEWLARAPEDGRHLIVLDALRTPHALGDAEAYAARLRDLEARWFAPLLAALRDGRIGMTTIHVPDGGEAASFETIRGDLRRFWRRARALAAYA